MRKLIVVLILSFIVLTSLGQEVKYPVKGELVNVKDWRKKVLLFKKGFWDVFRDTLISQIGQDEFEKVKRFSSVTQIPYELTLFKGFKKSDKTEKEALYVKLKLLKSYKIATIVNKGYESGSMSFVILRTPYNENVNWDPVAKWDTVYFVIAEEQVEYKK